MNRIFSALIVGALTVVSAKAQSAEMGPLDEFLKTGIDGAWEAKDSGDFYILDNDETASAIRMYYVNPRDGQAGNRQISVDVDLKETSPASRAGILYGYIEDPKSYFTFTLDADGSVSLFEIGGGKADQRVNTQIDAVKDGVNTLTLLEQGQTIALFVNGEKLTELGNDRMGRGGAGIVAWEPGEYAFRNFDIDTVVLEKGSGDVTVPKSN